MAEQFSLSHQLVAVYNGCYSGPNIPAKIVQNDGTLRVVKVPTGEELFPVSRWHRKDKRGELFALCRYEIAETFVQRLPVQKREAVVAFLQDTSAVQLRLNENEKNPARPYGIRLYLAQENRFRNPAVFNLSLDYHNPAFYWSFTAELVGSLEREPVWNAWFKNIQTYYNTTKFTPDITRWELEIFKDLGILIGNFTKYGVATVIANYADTDPKTGKRRFNPEKLKQYAREKRELERQRFYPEDQGEVLQAFAKVIADLVPFLFPKDVVASILAEFEQENKQIEQENNRQAVLRAARQAERKAKEVVAAQSSPTPSWERAHQRVVSASALRTNATFLGHEVRDGVKTREEVWLADAALSRGMYLVGKPGTAKSTLFINRILQDIDKGIGVCFVDPTGEAIKDLIARIPEERIRNSDVLLIDPLHDDYCFGWNPYECENPKDRRMVLEASRRAMHMYQLLYAHKQTGNLDVLVDQYLRNSVHTLIQNGLTMAELPLLFTNEQVRSKLLANVTSSKVLSFWEDEYDPLLEHEKREMCRMALNQVDGFLENDFSVSIVGQTSTTIDFTAMINEGKILLVKLSNRPVYKELSRLVGAVIIAELLNAALSRSDIPAMSQWRQFNIYADEFHEFATADWSELIEQARKYKIGTTFGHQLRSQLVDATAREGMLVTRNLAVGSISGKDAEEVAKEFDCTPPSVKTRPVPDVLGYLLHKGRHPDERVNAFVHRVTGVMGRQHAMLPLLNTVLSLAQLTPKEALLAALPETQKATFLWYFLRVLPAELYFHELPPAQFDPRLDKRPDSFLTSILSELPEEARQRALGELEQRIWQDTAATDGREAERLVRHKATEANVQTAERLLLQMLLTADNPNGQAFQAAAAAFEWLIRPHFFERQTWKRDPSSVEYRSQTELRSSPYHYTTSYPSVVMKDTFARNVLARFPFLSIDRNRTDYKRLPMVLVDKEFCRIVEEKFQDEKQFTETYLRDFAQVLSILVSEPITEGSRPHEQPLTFADMANKVADDLKKLPDFHFRCILQEGGRAVERTVAIPPLTGGVDEAEYARRLRIIDENTFLAGCYRKREEVEEEIRQRQARWRRNEAG